MDAEGIPWRRETVCMGFTISVFHVYLSRSERKYQMTYALWDFDMLDKHNHLLLRNKALEVIPRLCGIIWLEVRHYSIPDQPGSKWE